MTKSNFGWFPNCNSNVNFICVVMDCLWVYKFEEKIMKPSFAQRNAHAEHWGRNPKKMGLQPSGKSPATISVPLSAQYKDISNISNLAEWNLLLSALSSSVYSVSSTVLLYLRLASLLIFSLPKFSVVALFNLVDDSFESSVFKSVCALPACP